MNSQVKLDKAKFERSYFELINFLQSSTFRAPIKKFIDDNCDKIENKSESSHKDFQLHKQFKDLVENILNIIKDQLKISDLDFIEFAKIGFERESDRPFFEQVIACESFEWFKNCMIKRNIQLKEQTLKLMYVNMGDQGLTRDSTLNKISKEKEEAELALAIAMSLAADEEKKKLYGNEENIDKAIEISKKEAQKMPQMESKLVGSSSKVEKLSETSNENSRVKEEITVTPVEDKSKIIETPEEVNPLEEKKEESTISPKKFVKVSKIKPNLQRYTPTYNSSAVNNLSNSSNSTLITEKDLKNKEVKKNNIDTNNYLLGKDPIDQKVIDLSKIQCRIDCYNENQAMLPFETRQLDDEFNRLNVEDKKNINEYRKKLLELKEQNRNEKIQNEVNAFGNLNEQLKKKI